MSSLSTIYIKKETLKTVLEVLEKKKENGIAITISISDQENQYNQNVAAFVEQSKDDRTAGKPKFYIGNGRVFWTDGKISTCFEKPEKQEQPPIIGAEDDFPF